MSSLTAKQAADLLGVTVRTLHRWEQQGKVKSTRTAGGQWRYETVDLLGGKNDSSLTVAYARVSTHAQKEDLKRQVQILEAFCAKQGWSFEVIQDLGSGINYRKKGLIRLIKLITTHQVERLVLSHKDRLLRFGSELVLILCEMFGTEVIIINRSDDSSLEEDLAQDVLEIITVFSARLYGSRSHKNKKIVQQLRDIAQELK